MKYGAGADICVGKFLSDGTWIDYARDWSASCPKIKLFQYEDTHDTAAVFLEDYHVRVGGRVFSALAGYDEDFGSIPRAFWATIGHPYQAKTAIQFTLHDEVYCMNLLSRKDGDELLLDTLAAFGDNTWLTRNKIWLAVRAGGGFVYPKTSEELALYKDYVFLTDLSKPVTESRLLGLGVRRSIRKEVSLD